MRSPLEEVYISPCVSNPQGSAGWSDSLIDSSVVDGVGFADDGALVVDSFRARYYAFVVARSVQWLG